MVKILVVSHCHERYSTLGKILANKLASDYLVFTLISKAKTGFGRFLDILFNGFPLVLKNEIILVDIFGYRAFIYDSLAILYGKIASKKIIVYVHGGDMAEWIDKYPRWYKYILSLPELVITPNKYLGLILEERGIKVHMHIPTFIDEKNYTFNLRTKINPNILYMRGMHRLYNPKMAIKAFSIIKKKIPNAKLTFVTNYCKEVKEYKNLVNKLELKDIEFIDRVKKEEVGMLINQFDLYIQTNNIENMPISILESWACGVPVVATNVGGVPFIADDGSDSILIAPNDYKSMAISCIKIINDSMLAERLSKQGRKKSMMYTWGAVSVEWRNILK